MISWVISLAAGFYEPSLLEPNEAKQKRLGDVAAMIRRADEQVETVRAEMKMSREELAQVGFGRPIGLENLPEITGRMLEQDSFWNSVKQLIRQANGQELVAKIGVPDLSHLAMVGTIESAQGRVAMIEDGQTQWVVGLGSYLLGSMRVVAIEPKRLILVFAGDLDHEARETYEIPMRSD